MASMCARLISLIVRLSAVLVTVSAVTIFTVMEVSSESMAQTIHAGDLLVVERAEWLRRHVPAARPRRLQLVVLRLDGETPHVKRLIGLAGDRVRILRGRLILNGAEVVEPYVHYRTGHDLASDSWPRDATAAGARDVIVPAHHYFVLGDNRDASLDSRHRGMVSETSLVGVVRFVWQRSASVFIPR